jgi:signal transduction histidine kinase
MGTALAIVGWLAFAAAAAAGALVRHTLAVRAEAVARACHEVRGSLTAARVGLEWGSRPSAASRLRAIELELERATAALDDLQEVERPGVGEAADGLVDVQVWLSDSVEAFRPLAEACGIELSLECPAPLGMVQGRRARLAQASDNLIANAIEHGGSPIRVRARVAGERVRIEVADGGPGLPAPVSELVRRRRPRRSRRQGRRGRGLAIARDVVVEQGGALNALPGVGEGARLVLELPLAEPPIERPLPGARQASSPP